jgi:hypothetical protein
MDFSKLSASDKMAIYASAAVAVLAIVALVQGWGALVILPLLAAVAMAAIVFWPQFSPTASLPGSKGTLMVIGGGVAAVFWVISALTWLDWIFGHLGRIDTLLYLLGLAASLWLGWTGWRALQAEGGTFTMGAIGAGTPPAASTPSMPTPSAPAEPTPPPPPPSATAQPMDTGAPPAGTSGESEEERS